MAMIGGFVAGLFVAHSETASGNNLIYTLGLVSLVIGIFDIFGKNLIKGPVGGLLGGLFWVQLLVLTFGRSLACSHNRKKLTSNAPKKSAKRTSFWS
jgi:hypothetical protein